MKNFNPSDELNVGENNYDYGESLYSKNKRAKKISSIITTVVVISSAGVAGGSIIGGLISSVSANEETYIVSNYSHQVSDILKMSFDIENSNGERLYFKVIVKDTNKEFYSLDISETKHYEFTVDELKEDTLYQGNIVSIVNEEEKINTNYSFDFEKL